MCERCRAAFKNLNVPAVVHIIHMIYDTKYSSMNNEFEHAGTVLCTLFEQR